MIVYIISRRVAIVAMRLIFLQNVRYCSPNCPSSVYVPRDVAGVLVQAPREKLSLSSESFPSDAARSLRPAPNIFA